MKQMEHACNFISSRVSGASFQMLLEQFVRTLSPRFSVLSNY